VRIDTGIDDGAGGGIAGDGVLQPGEVRQTQYVCNGAPGANAVSPPPSGGGDDDDDCFDPDEEHAHHLFVVDEDERLVGQLSLYELVIADPRTPVGDLMHDDPVSVMTSDDEDEIVEAVMKYNLLAVPVVDEQERLVGVITVDDVIDLVGPSRGSRGLLG
jgi:hypothetical protein